MPLFVQPDHSTSTWFEDWQLFRYSHGSYLLHIPTAHILSIDEKTADHMESEKSSTCQSGLRGSLKNLADTLPSPVERIKESVDIRAIALNVIQSCNLRCTYCYAGDGDYGANSTMTLATAKSVIDQFADGKAYFSVAFFGGEPLLSFKLIQDIVSYCREKKDIQFQFSMTTNATLLNDNMMKYLKAEDFRLTISYDGKHIQDKQRLLPNKKDHADTLVKKKLARFKDALATVRNFAIRGTIRREFLKELPHAIFDILNSTEFRFHFNRHASSKNMEMFNRSDVKLIKNALDQVIGELISSKRYDDLLRLGNLKSHMSAFHHGERNQNYCGAGIHYLSVATDGSYYLCHRFTEDRTAAIGSIRDGLDYDRMSQYSNHRLVNKDPCKSCWMKQWCGGGCFHENRLANQNDFQPDAIFCELQDVEMKCAMYVYTILRDEQPNLLESL